MDSGASSPDWFVWGPDPSILAGVLAVSLAYGLAIRAVERRSRRAPSLARRVLFVAVIGTLLLALASPLHELAEKYLFTAHMLQHLFLMLVVPPLLLGALTSDVARILIPERAHGFMRFLTRPLVAYALCNGVFIVSHVPSIYDRVLRDHSLHVATHLLFLVTSILLWWPILGPLPEIPRAAPAAQLLYLFLQVLPGSLIGGLVANATEPLYPFYAASPRLFGLSPLADQQLGAIVMWVGGGTFFLAAFTVVFFRWALPQMEHTYGPSARR